MDKILDHLKNKIIPFWINLTDHKNGGFYGFMNNDLMLNKQSDKSLISHSRHLYSFSLWYEYFKTEELEDAANHAYKYLENEFVDKYFSGYYWNLSYDGKPIDKTKNIYGHAFVIYGLSEYGRVFNNNEAINKAFELFLLIEKQAYDQGYYKEQFNEKWIKENGTLVAPEEDNYPYTTNTLLHIFEAYTNLYKVKKDELLKDRLLEIVNTFKEKLYDEKNNSFFLYFNDKKEVVKQSGSYGHDIETCWLLDETIKVLKIEDKKLDEIILKVAEAVYKNAFTNEGLIIEVSGIDVNNKIWWVQAEAMVGFYNHYQKTKDPIYLEAVKSIYKFTAEVIVDKRNGSEWFWGVDENNNPLKNRGIVEGWKSSYHNGRAFIELLKRGLKL